MSHCKCNITRRSNKRNCGIARVSEVKEAIAAVGAATENRNHILIAVVVFRTLSTAHTGIVVVVNVAVPTPGTEIAMVAKAGATVVAVPARGRATSIARVGYTKRSTVNNRLQSQS